MRAAKGINGIVKFPVSASAITAFIAQQNLTRKHRSASTKKVKKAKQAKPVVQAKPKGAGKIRPRKRHAKA